MLDSLDTLIAFALIFTVVSLLVTIVVQMFSSLCNLRGRNLCWALAETIETIDPGLAGQARALADHLLRDPLLSDKQMWGREGLANAVRPRELFDVLQRIALGTKPAPPEIKAGVVSLFRALGVSEAELQSPGGTADQAKGVLSAVLKSVEALADEGQKKDITSSLEKALEALEQTAAGKVAAVAGVAEQKVRNAYQRFATWFGTAEERAQEWFTMHAHTTTVVVSVAFVFLLQLDAIEIFRTMSTNRAVRDKLVAQTAAVLGQGEKVLGAPGVLSQAFDTWRPQQSEPIKAAVAQANLTVLETDTRASFTRRLQAALAGVAAPAQPAAALKAFDDAVTASATAALKENWASYGQVKGDLDNTGFVLFPTGSAGRWGQGWWSGAVFKAHGVGLFFSILLLSLGAPFWFNTLKSLASLRSSVAGNIEGEKKDGGPKPAKKEPVAASPPPQPVGFP